MVWIYPDNVACDGSKESEEVACVFTAESTSVASP